MFDEKTNDDKKVNLALRINAKLYQSLHEAAKNAGISLEDLVEKILTEYVAKKHAKVEAHNE